MDRLRNVNVASWRYNASGNRDLRIDLLRGFAVVAGSLSESSFGSAALGQTMPYAIYLPPSYATEPDRRFPVVYLFHGAGGRYTEWSVYGLPQKAAQMMADGQLTEFIIVMPEGGRGYWANGLNGNGENWADYITNDFVSLIDSTYRTVPQASQRAVGGLSRGGFGALYLAFTYPDLFSIVAANSPSLPGDSSGVEDSRISAQDFPAYDPVEIARKMDTATAPTIWIDIGNQDGCQPGLLRLQLGQLRRPQMLAWPLRVGRATKGGSGAGSKSPEGALL